MSGSGSPARTSSTRARAASVMTRSGTEASVMCTMIRADAAGPSPRTHRHLPGARLRPGRQGARASSWSSGPRRRRRSSATGEPCRFPLGDPAAAGSRDRGAGPRPGHRRGGRGRRSGRRGRGDRRRAASASRTTRPTRSPRRATSWRCATRLARGEVPQPAFGVTPDAVGYPVRGEAVGTRREPGRDPLRLGGRVRRCRRAAFAAFWSGH